MYNKDEARRRVLDRLPHLGGTTEQRIRELLVKKQEAERVLQERDSRILLLSEKGATYREIAEAVGMTPEGARLALRRISPQHFKERSRPAKIEVTCARVGCGKVFLTPPSDKRKYCTLDCYFQVIRLGLSPEELKARYAAQAKARYDTDPEYRARILATVKRYRDRNKSNPAWVEKTRKRQKGYSKRWYQRKKEREQAILEKYGTGFGRVS